MARLDFSGMLQTWWRTLSNPAITLKKEAKSGQKLEAGIMAFLIAAVVSASLIFLLGSIWALLGGVAAIFALIVMSAQVAVGVMFLSFIYAGIIHLCAKVDKGKGAFHKFYYLTSTFMAPLIVISSFVVFVPLFGPVFSVLLLLYGLYLTVIALRALHGFTMFRAVMVLLMPAAVCLVVMLGLLFLALLLFASRWPR